jgi:hypothetical protein
MRAHRGDTLHKVEFDLRSLKHMQDRGIWNPAELRRLSATGFDGVAYLNRYEGIACEAFDSVSAGKPDIARASDNAFSRAFPTAEMSWIVFDPAKIVILRRQQLCDI